MDGRIALITGATSGIGRATALRFAADGAAIAAVGRNTAELAALRSEVAKREIEFLEISADVTDEAAARRIVAETVNQFGRIDTLINAAGQIVNGTIEQTSLSDWDAMMNVNLRSIFYLMQLAVPHLEKGRGSVVNVSSVTGLRAFPGVLAYCVSKAGVDQLTRCAALELAAKGIRVNAVNPGVVVTDLHRRAGMNEEAYQAFLERSPQTHPLGRAGEATEVADLIYYLASDRAAWITGATYSIDGGRAQTCAR
jgi:NAD(P)-dependent dehydrogenase (short-subunit alcohol dehydrogenase family)